MLATLLAALAIAEPPVDPPSDYALISPGTFHGDQMPYESGPGWVGLYRSEDGFELRETSIEVKAVKDEIIDNEEGQKTGREVTASAGNDAIYLFRGPGLAAGKVKAVFDSKQFIYPGQSVRHRSGEGWLDITALATVTKRSERPWGEPEFKDYVLEVTERVDGELRSITIAPDRESWDDARPQLVFVGDLDGDGRLDLIVDPSAHYNVSNPTLLLSAPAGKEGVLKIVANHATTGC